MSTNALTDPELLVGFRRRGLVLGICLGAVASPHDLPISYLKIIRQRGFQTQEVYRWWTGPNSCRSGHGKIRHKSTTIYKIEFMKKETLSFWCWDCSYKIFCPSQKGSTPVRSLHEGPVLKGIIKTLCGTNLALTLWTKHISPNIQKASCYKTTAAFVILDLILANLSDKKKAPLLLQVRFLTFFKRPRWPQTKWYM